MEKSHGESKQENEKRGNDALERKGKCRRDEER